MAAEEGSHSLGYSCPRRSTHTSVYKGNTNWSEGVLTAKVKIGREAGRRDGQFAQIVSLPKLRIITLNPPIWARELVRIIPPYR